MTVRDFVIPGTPVRVVASDAVEGDQRPPSPMSPAMFTALGERPWSWLHQKHGTDVHVVRWPGDRTGSDGDGLVTDVEDAVLVAFSADCPLVALGSAEGVAGIVHAGWRGLVSGMVEEGVRRMRDLGAGQVFAWRAACIHAECYEFGEDELERAVGLFGEGVRAETSEGRPALDLPAGVRIALDRSGALLVGEQPECTACSPGWFSWRARQDTGRVAVAVRVDKSVT
ncbi:MAG TPA: polyphenol oxidase family protein [Acidimicrobiales bacterium]|nr:polyphenol oxidase family protein [Acidimicrobiales bacterium]